MKFVIRLYRLLLIAIVYTAIVKQMFLYCPVTVRYVSLNFPFSDNDSF